MTLRGFTKSCDQLEDISGRGYSKTPENNTIPKERRNRGGNGPHIAQSHQNDEPNNCGSCTSRSGLHGQQRPKRPAEHDAACKQKYDFARECTHSRTEPTPAWNSPEV